MTTEPTVSEILRRWQDPNRENIRTLISDGFSEEAALQYDRMERRESCLLDLMDAFGLSDEEQRELRELQASLTAMQQAADEERQQREQARAAIEDRPRRILTVRFIKRTPDRNGQRALRVMRCVYYPDEAARTRFRFNPRAKDLVPVWDTEKGGRRFVSLEGVREVICGGQRVYGRIPSGRASSGSASPRSRPRGKGPVAC